MNHSESYAAAIAAIRKSKSGSGSPLFHAPWQARIFALIVEIVKAGHFPWAEFQTRLVEALARYAETSSGETDETIERKYFDAWLQAAEETLLAGGFVRAGEIDSQIVSVRASVESVRSGQQPLAFIHK